MTQTSSPSAPSRAHARLQMSTTASSPMVDMTHSPCQRLVSTRVSTSGAPTTSTTQSSQEVETSPTTTISSLLQRQASQVSTSPGKSVAQGELEFCAAGSNTVPVYVWLLPVSSDNASLPNQSPQPRRVSSLKAHHPHSRRWISDSAEDNKLSSYLRHDNITWNDWNVNDYEYQGGLTALDLKLTYWYIIAKPADGATTSQIFMNAKLTYYCELSENQSAISHNKEQPNM